MIIDFATRKEILEESDEPKIFTVGDLGNFLTSISASQNELANIPIFINYQDNMIKPATNIVRHESGAIILI